jgi:hypothetical protein
VDLTRKRGDAEEEAEKGKNEIEGRGRIPALGEWRQRRTLRKRSELATVDRPGGLSY